MKLNKLIYIIIFLMFNVVHTQDSIKVSTNDWEFIKQTTNELQMALDISDTLNVVYAERVKTYQNQIYHLSESNLICDTMLINRNETLQLRQEQIDILNMHIKKQTIELWLTRSGGLILIVGAVVLLK